MKEVSFFKKDTDAIGTNRGFLYQYMYAVYEWLKVFNKGLEDEIYCENEEDLKRVLIDTSGIQFQQFKCYSSSFSMNSKEVKKTIFNFFCLYIKYKAQKPEFVFCTNTGIKKEDTLLASWNRFQDTIPPNILDELKKVIEENINEELKLTVESEENKLNKEKTKLEKKTFKNKVKEEKRIAEIENIEIEIERNGNYLVEMCKHLSKELVPFIKSIRFSFSDQTPEDSLKNIEQNCIVEIRNIKENVHSENLFFARLVTEVMKRSSMDSISDRKIDKLLLSTILTESKDEIEKNVNNEVLEKIEEGFKGVNVKLDLLNDKIDNLSAKGSPTNGSPIHFPKYSKEKIDNQIENESNTDSTKKYQSNLEVKIEQINWTDQELKKSMLEDATELRCRYALYLEELQLGGRNLEYDALKSLEGEVKTKCINAVEKLGIVGENQSNLYWVTFKDNLIELLKNFNTLWSFNIQESIIIAQMYHIAAECHLRWKIAKKN